MVTPSAVSTVLPAGYKKSNSVVCQSQAVVAPTSTMAPASFSLILAAAAPRLPLSSTQPAGASLFMNSEASPLAGLRSGGKTLPLAARAEQIAPCPFGQTLPDDRVAQGHASSSVALPALMGLRGGAHYVQSRYGLCAGRARVLLPRGQQGRTVGRRRPMRAPAPPPGWKPAAVSPQPSSTTRPPSSTRSLDPSFDDDTWEQE